MEDDVVEEKQRRRERKKREYLLQKREHIAPPTHGVLGSIVRNARREKNKGSMMALRTGWRRRYLWTAHNGLGGGGRRRERAHLPPACGSSVKRPGTLPSQPTPGGVVQAPLLICQAA